MDPETGMTSLKMESDNLTNAFESPATEEESEDSCDDELFLDNTNSSVIFHHHHQYEEEPLDSDPNSIYAKSKGALALMRQLHQFEQQFWAQQHVNYLRRNSGRKGFGSSSAGHAFHGYNSSNTSNNNVGGVGIGSQNSFASTTNTSGANSAMDLFKCCPQGSAISSKDYNVITPGPFHSCPTLHLHGESYYYPPPHELETSPLVNDNENRIEARANNLKGQPILSSRTQKRKPSCKFCSCFGFSSKEQEEAVACSDSLYETYKRNCTYRDCTFEKPESLDPSKDPAEPLKELFSSKNEPTLEEIGKALIPGTISSSTPANWVQELIDILDPNPKPSAVSQVRKPGINNFNNSNISKKYKALHHLRLKKFPKLNKAKSSMSRSSNNIQNGTVNNNNNNKNNTTKLLAATSSASYSGGFPMKTFSYTKIHSKFTRKLKHIKSRYLDHFQKDRQKIEAIGDGTDILAKVEAIPAAAVSTGISKGQGDGGTENKTKQQPLKRIGPSVSSIFRLSRPTTSTSTKSMIPNRFSTKFRKITAERKRVNKKLKKKNSKKDLRKHDKMKPKINKKNLQVEVKSKTKPIPQQQVQKKSVLGSFVRSRRRPRSIVVKQGCGFEFEDVPASLNASQLNNALPYQYIPTKKRKHRKRKRRKTLIDDIEAAESKKALSLEKYKQAIIKMLETGSLFGSATSSASTTAMGTDVGLVKSKVISGAAGDSNSVRKDSSNTGTTGSKDVLNSPRKQSSAIITKTNDKVVGILRSSSNKVLTPKGFSSLSAKRQQDRPKLLDIKRQTSKSGSIVNPVPLHSVKLDFDPLPTNFKPMTIPIPTNSTLKKVVIPLETPAICSTKSSRSRVHSLSKYSHICPTDVMNMENAESLKPEPAAVLAFNGNDVAGLESVITTKKLVPLEKSKSSSRARSNPSKS